jgi:membrane protein YqaA with SNARE-associated domain
VTDPEPDAPRPDPARALGVALAHAEALVDATGGAVEWGAATSADLTRRAVGAGVRELTRFGRLVLRAWQAFERLANPPWTAPKVLAWAAIFLTVAVVTVLAYQVRYGLLTLPMVEDAGLRFVAWLASLGPLGLFAFTAFGTLFFMIIPTEPFFFIMLSGDASLAATVLAAALGSTVGSCINYWFGNRLRVSAGKKRPGEERKLGKWGQRAISRSGTALLFAASALPLPELVGVAYGVVDYPFRRFALVAGAGRLVKWSWIAAAYLAVGFTL